MGKMHPMRPMSAKSNQRIINTIIKGVPLLEGGHP